MYVCMYWVHVHVGAVIPVYMHACIALEEHIRPVPTCTSRVTFPGKIFGLCFTDEGLCKKVCQTLKWYVHTLANFDFVGINT